MKQNPPSAKPEASLIALLIFALGLSASACARLPPRASSAVQYRLDTARPEAGSVTNINTAASQELEKLPGIGKGIAERIIAHRERYGQFRRAEHLMMVRGISDRKFRSIRSMIRVD